RVAASRVSGRGAERYRFAAPRRSTVAHLRSLSRLVVDFARRWARAFRGSPLLKSAGRLAPPGSVRLESDSCGDEVLGKPAPGPLLAGGILCLCPEQLDVLLGDQLPNLDVVEHDDLHSHVS